jgi:hypothetical protein
MLQRKSSSFFLFNPSARVHQVGCFHVVRFVFFAAIKMLSTEILFTDMPIRYCPVSCEAFPVTEDKKDALECRRNEIFYFHFTKYQEQHSVYFLSLFRAEQPTSDFVLSQCLVNTFRTKTPILILLFRKIALLKVPKETLQLSALTMLRVGYFFGHNVQTCSGVHPTFYSLGTRFLLRGNSARTWN